VTDKGKEMPGSAPLTVAFPAPHFAARGADVEAESSEDEQGQVLAAPGNAVIFHRAGALVFIQPVSSITATC
jgi:hypothetical protein